jgi:hypothetical protein
MKRPTRSKKAGRPPAAPRRSRAKVATQSAAPRRVESRLAPPRRAERRHARPGAGIKRSRANTLKRS